MTPKVSIHAKKFFRVVLEGFDSERENADSFALKLSMRTRTTLPRAKQVVRTMPCTIKRAIGVDQANQLKNNVEAIGGRLRVESYLVTPGEDRPLPKKVPKKAEAPKVEAPGEEAPKGEAPEVEVAQWICVTCGGQRESGDGRCSFCDDGLTPTREEIDDAPELPSEEYDPAIESVRSTPDFVTTLRDNKYLVAAGVLAILLAIAIFKQ